MLRILSLSLAFIFLLLLFVGGPGPDASRLLKHCWDLGHIMCFALWSWLFLQYWPSCKFWRQCVILIPLSLILGGVIELVQAQFLVGAGREGSWEDLQKDFLGCLLVLFFITKTRRQLGRGALYGLQLLVLLMLFWNFLPLVTVATDELRAWRQFPLLSGFEYATEAGRWEGNSQRQIVSDPVYRGNSALQVQLNTDQYSGVVSRHFPIDWSGYRQLELAVYNPDQEPLPLNLRIHDQLHRQFENAYSDRFNARYIFKNGWTQISVSLDEVARAPKGRLMDMSRIAGVQLFSVKLERSRTLVIDDIRLVREPLKLGNNP